MLAWLLVYTRAIYWLPFGFTTVFEALVAARRIGVFLRSKPVEPRPERPVPEGLKAPSIRTSWLAIRASSFSGATSGFRPSSFRPSLAPGGETIRGTLIPDELRGTLTPAERNWFIARAPVVIEVGEACGG